METECLQSVLTGWPAAAAIIGVAFAVAFMIIGACKYS